MTDVTTTAPSAAATEPTAAPTPLDTIETMIEKTVADLTAERDALKAKVADLEAALVAKGSELTTAVEAAVEATKAEGAKALEDLKDSMKPVLAGAVAERDKLKADLANAIAAAHTAGATVAAGTRAVFASAEDEAAYLKTEIGTGITNVQAKASRLADVVPRAAMHPIMSFHAAVGGLKALAEQLL